MRAFIAIDLPKEIKDYLADIQAQLKESNSDVKWVAPLNIHLTLKFLGEIDEKKSENIIQIIEEIAKNSACFYIRISSIGAFPKINFPRVLWVGIDKGDRESKEIAEQLEERIAKLGIPKEDRPFSSHITIGRLRSNLNREKLIQKLSNLAAGLAGLEKLQFTVKKITLFKSTLTPKGPVYEIIRDTALRQSAE